MANEVHIHVPVPEESDVGDGLVRLTQAIDESGLAEAAVCGIFGGRYGYGCDYENDVFEMRWMRQHPECRCGGSKPLHKETCDTVTKRSAWLDTRNAIGMVDSGNGWSTNTPTTYAEQEAWMEANPFPSCSCDEEAAWIERNGPIPDDDSGFFHRTGDNALKYKHDRTCDIEVFQRPQFTHKPSGSTVCWYKYIGRDMQPDLKTDWDSILIDCLRSLERPMPRG